MGICSLISALLFSSIKYFAFYLQLTWHYFIVVIELIFSGLQNLLGLLQNDWLRTTFVLHFSKFVTIL